MEDEPAGNSSGIRGSLKRLLESASDFFTTKLELVNIEIQEEDGSLSANVGSFGSVKSQQLKNEAGQPMTMQNVGFAVLLQLDNNTLKLAPSGSRRIDPDLPHKFKTKSGAMGTLTWTVS